MTNSADGEDIFLSLSVLAFVIVQNFAVAFTGALPSPLVLLYL